MAPLENYRRPRHTLIWSSFLNAVFQSFSVFLVCHANLAPRTFYSCKMDFVRFYGRGNSRINLASFLFVDNYGGGCGWSCKVLLSYKSFCGHFHFSHRNSSLITAIAEFVSGKVII